MNPFTNYTDSQQTTRCLARDAKDREIGPLSPHAVRWCAYGVMYREMRPDSQIDKFRSFIDKQTGCTVQTLNDCDRKPFSWFRDRWQECFGE